MNPTTNTEAGAVADVAAIAGPVRGQRGVGDSGSLQYRTSWPRPATPCDLVPLWKGEFVSFDDWVNFASTRLCGTSTLSGVEVAAICVDAIGRRCVTGREFMRARDEGAFPVRYFWECVPSHLTEQGVTAS